MAVQARFGILAAGLFWACATAQTDTATVLVQAGMPGVTVVLMNQQTNEKFTAETGADGRHEFRAVPAGVYSIEARRSGFTRYVRSEISVTAGQSLTVEIQMRRPSFKARPPVAMAPPPPPTAPAAARLTGRAFLVGEADEAAGYGLYSYVLFASAPMDTTRERFLSTFRAYLRMLTTAQDLETAGAQRNRLNITYLPVKAAPGEAAPDEAWALQNYNWARAQVLLARFPGGAGGPGPYIISTLKPLSAVPPEHYLFQDLSAVPPSLIPAWFQEFLTQAAQDHFWEPPAVLQFALKLRTNIEIAALALPDVESAGKAWKSLLATWITEK